MKFLWLPAAALGVVALLLTFRAASNQWAEDRCLDRGGAYYGTMGCLEALPPSINRIIVNKSERRLHAYQGTKLIRSFDISLGGEPSGDKRQEGDNRTPEGVYPVV